MILNKSLLLKCLGGVAACTGVAGVGILGSQSNLGGTTPKEDGNENGQLPQPQQDNTKLTEKAGLNCNDSTKECTLKEGSKINVKHDQTQEEGKSFTSGDSVSGKIKLQTETTDTAGKTILVIEGGDISLTSENNASQTITKLEQFETYEIEEVDESGNKKYFLSRKTKASEGIRKELGLPEGCSLPETSSTSSSNPTCTINTTDISKVKFDGVSDGQTVTSSGEVTLTVTKLSSSDSDFPFNYKFEFKGSSSEVTLNLGNNNTITLKNTEATEFGIKKGASGNSISLKEVGTLKDLLGKVGLTTCTVSGTTECAIGSDGIKVKHENGSGEEGKKKSSSSAAGKIKVYTDSNTSSYNKSFKFVIEEADISFETGGTVSKLEQFETYEIKEDGSGSDKKWYLTRKTKAAEGIRKELSLPDTCTLPETTNVSSSSPTCTINTTDISKVKFEGVSGEQTVTGSGDIELTVTKLSTTEEDFSYDYKFSFKGKDGDVTLTINSTKITLKSGEGTEFRIKKGASGNSITLEEAWSLNRLLEKVGLSGCTTENTTECSISNGGLNVKQDNNSQENKTKDTNNGASTGKIKVYSDTTYNKGFKFVIEEGDISFGSSETISKLEQFETYEIKKEDSSSKWYLTRKSKASEEIKTALGLPTDNCTLPTAESTPTTCSNIDDTKLKAINFDGKDSTGATITNSGTATLTITKTSDTTNYPLGYKLSFEPTETITISSTSSIKIMKKTNTEFKIKVTKSSGTTPVKLSLEKAWTAKSLGEKVGLNCPDSNGDKKCSFTDGSINVKNGDNDKIEKAKTDSSDKKMTYQEDQEGYNQGIKFYLEENEDITLTSGSGSDDSSGGKKICKKDNNGSGEITYEIKEDTTDKKWYLTKKETSNGIGS